MYHFLLWDRAELKNITSVKISQELFELFSILNEDNFPILANLSPYDYDTFLDEDLYRLRDELQNFITIHRHEEIINSAILIINNAESLRKQNPNICVLFDPFSDY